MEKSKIALVEAESLRNASEELEDAVMAAATEDENEEEEEENWSGISAKV